MAKATIVCVDDENVVLLSLRDQLTHNLTNQFTIEIAESGQEALEIFEDLHKENIDIPLIISDQIMPGMTGDELLKHIHDRYPETLKILLTGQATTDAVGKAVNNAGLYHYISKPWEEQALCLTVKEAIRRYFQEKQIKEQRQELEQLYAQAQKEIDERKKIEKLLEEANKTLEQKVHERTQKLSQTLEELKSTQNQLIMQEKMASLGMLTAGIAHEIKNPLNFVNNFALLSIELAEDLEALLKNMLMTTTDDIRVEAIDLLENIKTNAVHINDEGRRADSIIHSMLLHSRGASGQVQKSDLNRLIDQAVDLAYHSLRAKDASFNIQVTKIFDDSIPPLAVIPQDLSRVFLNIINNACYAVHQKKLQHPPSFEPELIIATKNLGTTAEIRIRDNGPGLEPDIHQQLFNPFFTTKPAGEGTGLGLSISYEIVVQGHQGQIEVETELGKFTEFIVTIPCK